MFWKKAARGRETTLFFASDLHGSTVCFRKFLGAAAFYGADLLVMGGDMTGKAILPIVRTGPDTYRATEARQPITLAGQAELDAFRQRFDDKGFYTVVLSEDEYAGISADPQRQDALFRRLVVERAAQWVELAERKLADTSVRIIASPGNDDFYEVDDVLKASKVIDYHDRELTECLGYTFLHCGGSNVTPWQTEREYTEEQLWEVLGSLAAKVPDPSRCIANIHVPPSDTALDECPKLDDQLQVVFEMGNPVSMHAGSSSVRRLILELQPLLGLHGHIHEGRANVRLGRTTCVNPGSTYSDGILQGSLVRLREATVGAVQMLQG